jgi:internalin A
MVNFGALRRTLQFRGMLLVSVALAANNAVIARDETPASKEIERLDDGAPNDLKGLREQGLNTLSLYHTQITDVGMKELSECNTLWSLALYSDVKIPKAGLKGLAKLKNLKELIVLGPPVTDADLAEIKALKNLTTLELSSPRSTITDAGLKELRPLKCLTRLELGFAHITDAGLRELRGLTNVTNLAVNHTGITKAGLKELGEHKNLTDLNLGDTGITDAALKELCVLKNLTELDVRNTAITDGGLRELRELKNLTTLCLINTRITDAGVKDIGQLKKLARLWLNDTRITDAGLAELHKSIPNANIVR